MVRRFEDNTNNCLWIPTGRRVLVHAMRLLQESLGLERPTMYCKTWYFKNLEIKHSCIGSPNLNQTFRRAGRHQPGEYFNIISQKRALELGALQ